MPRRRSPTRSRSRDRSGGRLEWIGGRLSLPFFIEDREEPYRPELVVWLEEPSGLVVGEQLIDPEDAEGAVAAGLLTALERPLAGSARQPDAIRVADASLAGEVQSAVGDSISVTVAPTPELHALQQTMLESMPESDEEASYLEGGRVSPATVAKLFSAAQRLFSAKPWKIAHDGQVLRMDIPALGVDGACISILGAAGGSLGLLMFPSLEGYEAFLRAAEGAAPEDAPIDLGTEWLALSFERGADLPPSMRREVTKHAWPVASASAYPVVEQWERDGASRPLGERDVEIATACALSLPAFVAEHRRLFEADEIEPVCESFFDEHDLEVRFTAPYQVFPLFERDEGPARELAPTAGRGRAKVGRNDPCPCGSGRKYKKCCLPRSEQERSPRRGRDAGHDLDEALTLELGQFAAARFGDAWRGFEKDFVDPWEVQQLSVPWSVYHSQVEGATVADRYLEERGRSLSRAKHAWLTAQLRSWLSVWEVTQVEPGASVTLRDLLSDETRSVREASASQTLVLRDALLARVVDHGGVSLLCGMHPRPLPPVYATEVVRRARGRLRRKRAVPVDKLRDEAFGRYLIRRWEEAVMGLDAARAIPPELRNTDGDPLLATIDHFEIAPGARPAVEAQLAALEGVEPPDAGEAPPVYVFLRPAASGEHLVIGQARLSDAALALETNSRERADALRERVEAACGNPIRHRAREHADPLSSKAARAGRDPAPEPPSPEAEQILLEFKQRHYAGWPEMSLPALGGKTPREAARSAQGRAAVDVLLKDMENHEQRSAGGGAFDFSEIRRELRLE